MLRIPINLSKGRIYLPDVSERYCVSEIYTQRKGIDRRSYAFCLTGLLVDFVLAQCGEMETN